jgi:polysaccharide export outer membrane protein
MKLRILAVQALLLAFALAAPQRALSQSSSTQPSGNNNATNAAPRPALPTSLAGYVPDDKHKLRIGDNISFQIMEDGDPPRGFIVNDSGEINFPYVGRWAVKDKSCKEVADLLKVELEKEYYFQATPILALEIANPVLGKIYFQGQVRSTGPMDLYVNDPLTIGKAILRAGGFADFANKKKVKLMRGNDKEGQPRQFYELDMEEILEQGKTEKDMLVQPDDFILVPSRIWKF